MLQANPRMLILDDPQEKDRLLSRILISKYYLANSFTYPEKRPDEIEKEKPGFLIFDSNFPETNIIRILQKVRENNPSLPISICFNSVSRQFKNQASQLGASVFFQKADVLRGPRVWMKRTLNRIGSGQMLDQIKKIVTPRRVSVNNERRGARHPSDLSKKRKKGGERTWQSKRTLALPA